MNKPQEKRTNRSLLTQLIQEIGGDAMKKEFERLFSSRLNSTFADQELTEGQYQFGLMKMGEELAAFKQSLLSNPDRR